MFQTNSTNIATVAEENASNSEAPIKSSGTVRETGRCEVYAHQGIFYDVLAGASPRRSSETALEDFLDIYAPLHVYRC
ncbi:MAG: hypothetical protein ACP5N3_02845 [Candidatus Nanoarchaeia archaeon]